MWGFCNEENCDRPLCYPQVPDGCGGRHLHNLQTEKPKYVVVLYGTVRYCMWYCMVLYVVLYGTVRGTVWYCTWYCMVLYVVLYGTVRDDVWGTPTDTSVHHRYLDSLSF